MLFRDKCDKAKQYAEKALKIAHSKNDKTIEGQCWSILGWVNEKIRTQSLNVFVFLKAWPIINADTHENVGPFTRITSNFKEDLCKAI